MAACHAATGAFERAVELQKQAIDDATKAGASADVLDAMRERRATFAARKAFLEIEAPEMPI